MMMTTVSRTFALIVALVIATPLARAQGPATADQAVTGALLYVNDGDIVLQPVSARGGVLIPVLCDQVDFACNCCCCCQPIFFKELTCPHKAICGEDRLNRVACKHACNYERASVASTIPPIGIHSHGMPFHRL